MGYIILMSADHISLSRYVYHPEKGPAFTRNEVRVLHFSLCDYCVKDIADELDIKSLSVYKYRERIVDKTPVHSFEAALVWVLTEGIFSVERELAG